MAGKPTPQAKVDEAVRLYSELKSTIKVGKVMGCSASAVDRYLDRAGVEKNGHIKTGVPQEFSPPPAFPEFPEEDVPVEEIIDHMSRRFEKRKASHDAHTWFPIKFKDDRPIGILLMGDPHVDDNGCDWPTLKRHAELCRDTDGLYAVNIGDTTNCWGGRLVRKYADQDTSAKTARRLAEWLLIGSGIRWLVWLYGNHEHMGDGMSVLAEMAKRYGTKKVVMHDWEARFILAFPNGCEIRVNAAHDFPGNSMWNPLHGPVKAAKFGDRVDLLACGHKHNYAVSQWEMPEGGVTPLMIRTRGYKFLDDFARKIGHYDQQEGQSVLVVVDPTAKTKAGRLTAFVDVEEGAAYLAFKRARA